MLGAAAVPRHLAGSHSCEPLSPRQTSFACPSACYHAAISVTNGEPNMAAVNPRIAVYLPKNVAATIRRLAGLRGVSRSAVIRDFLVDAEPVMARVANLLDLAARSDRSALKEWAVTLENAQSGLEADATAAMAHLGEMETALEAAPAARRRRARRTPGQ